MDIPNWRAIVGKRSDLPQQIELSEAGNEQEFDKVYEAWKQYYPNLTAQEIAYKIGVKVRTVQAYITQLNATGGNVVATKLRLRLYSERSNLRGALANNPDPEVVAELMAIDAKLTREIDCLKTGRRAPRKTWVQRLDDAVKQAEWEASGIDD